jgi:hypothetical protein
MKVSESEYLNRNFLNLKNFLNLICNSVNSLIL